VSSWKAEKRKRFGHGESGLIKAVQINTNDRTAITYLSKNGKASVERRILEILRHITRTRDSGRGPTEHIIGDKRQRAGRARYISHINGVSPRGVQRSGPATRGAVRARASVEFHEVPERAVQFGHRHDIGNQPDCVLDVVL
jgi:hypothetical protein